MFSWIKNYFVLAALLWIGCAPAGPTGNTAASHLARHADGNDINDGNGSGAIANAYPDKHVRTYTLEKYGELEVTKPMAEIVAKQPFEISLTFTASQPIAPIQKDDHTRRANMRVLFEKDSDIAVKQDITAGSEFIKQVKDNMDEHKFFMIYPKEMQVGDNFSMTFTITPKKSFSFDVTMQHEGSSSSFFGSRQHIVVTPLPPPSGPCDSEESEARMHASYSNREFNATVYGNTKGKMTVTTAEDHVYAKERNTLAVKFTAARSIKKNERINVVFPTDNFVFHINRLGRSSDVTDESASLRRHYSMEIHKNRVTDKKEYVYAIFPNNMSKDDSFTIRFPFTAKKGSQDGYRIVTEIGRSGAFSAFKSDGNYPAVKVVPKRCD